MAKQKEPPIFILSGAAGSGKDTQCTLVAEKYHFAVITISALLKEYILESEETGGGTRPSEDNESIERIKKCMNDGSLVSDDTVIKVFMHRLKKYINGEEPCAGILVNGFPRSYEQALLFAKNGTQVASFIHIQVKKETLMSRVSNRMADPLTHMNYNAKGVEVIMKKKKGVQLTPEEELLLSSQGDAFKNVTDEVLARLARRADDDEATFLKRFHLYEQSQEKIVSLFPTVYRSVDGNGSIEETFAQICAIIDAGGASE
ncbi:adenylate kinase [Plasmodium vivax India VII]|uniref:Adenylate kinase n=2 Tax=Plasmodium vivax TaxID=5855 RepID=A0A0J9TH38_PLAVI|nr:adenylate kinase [Plasmodium vivax India VII]KMZ94524.1 adenylate kinase [Plasmodium vivax Mauritania I]